MRTKNGTQFIITRIVLIGMLVMILAHMVVRLSCMMDQRKTERILW